jgi:hypothetical protein
MFGGKLANFGFAFNQGTFQAIELGKGLHDFTIGQAPDGSLDRTLARSGTSGLGCRPSILAEKRPCRAVVCPAASLAKHWGSLRRHPCTVSLEQFLRKR